MPCVIDDIFEHPRLASIYSVAEIAGVGAVESWVDVTDDCGQLMTFRWNFVFASDGLALISDSTLRFRERADVEAALIGKGFTVQDVRDAPDRPGREFVFLARRPDRRSPTGRRRRAA